MKILFLASGAFAIASLKALHGRPNTELSVITQPDKPSGRGRKLMPTPVALAAADLGLPLSKFPSVNDHLGDLPMPAPDLCVVIAFGQKLSDAFLQIARHGAINLHGSLLPKFRGAAPIQWSILAGDAVAGVTVIRVNALMDGGDILTSASTPIGESETAGELHDRLAVVGVTPLLHAIDGLMGGTLVGLPQDHALATKAPKLSKAMAWVDFSQDAVSVSCRIRALSPWPACRARLIRKSGRPPLNINLLKVVARQGDAPAAPPGTFVSPTEVACGTGTISLLVVQPEHRNAMAMGDFINGHAIETGDQLISAPPAGGG